MFWQAICHIYLIIYKFSIYKFSCSIMDISNVPSSLRNPRPEILSSELPLTFLIE